MYMPMTKKIYTHISNNQDRILLQDYTNKLATWPEEWLFKLNINQCKIVSCGRNIDHNYP